MYDSFHFVFCASLQLVFQTRAMKVVAVTFACSQETLLDSLVHALRIMYLMVTV